MSDQPASGHGEPEGRDTESTGAHSCAKANRLLGMKKEKCCIGEAVSLLRWCLLGAPLENAVLGISKKSKSKEQKLSCWIFGK